MWQGVGGGCHWAGTQVKGLVSFKSTAQGASCWEARSPCAGGDLPLRTIVVAAEWRMVERTAWVQGPQGEAV